MHLLPDQRIIKSVGIDVGTSTSHLIFSELVLKKDPKSKTEKYPNYRLAEFHYMLGTIYKKNGKKDLAKNEYETALNLFPAFEDAKEALDDL